MNPIPQAKLSMASYKTSERRRGKTEPTPEDVAPDRPAWLSPKAAAHWDKVVGYMRAVPGWLRVTDGDVLAQYCQGYSDFVELRTAVESEGWSVEGSTGSTVLNPKVRAMETAHSRWYKGSSQLGLSPVDRARISLEQSKPTDKASAFLEVG